MNAERQKAGFFSRALSLLTHNWGLKILALVLAIIAYHALKTGSSKDIDPNDRPLFHWR